MNFFAKDRVRITKIHVFKHLTSSVAVGYSITGQLSYDIRVGQKVSVYEIEKDKELSTSSITEMWATEDNRVILHTKTSIYLLERAPKEGRGANVSTFDKLKKMGYGSGCNVRVTKKQIRGGHASDARVGISYPGRLLEDILPGKSLWMEVRDVTGRGSGTFNTSAVEKVEIENDRNVIITTETSIYLLEQA